MVLLPLVCSKVDVPVIGAGGICDGRSMAAAFALGAEGVQMGTRMVSAAESPVHDELQAPRRRLARDRHRLPEPLAQARASASWRRPFSEAHEQSDEQVALGTLDGILHLYFEGDLDAAFAFGGQVAGRIDEVRPVAEILHDTIDEFRAVLGDLADRYTA